VKRWIIALCLSLICLSLIPIYAQAPTPTPGPDCSKTPVSKLAVNGKALVVSPTDKKFAYPSGLLKVKADNISPVLRYLPLGTVVDVVEAAQCGAGNANWVKVKLANVTGYMAETSGKDYVLTPYAGLTAPPPLPSTSMDTMVCIAARKTPEPPTAATASATEAATHEPSPTPTVDPAQVITRVVYSGADGGLAVSDNGGVSHVITRFDPAPLNVDLSPDGSAALVATYNGLYWVDVANGNTLLVADAQKFNLGQGGWINKMAWFPDGSGAAVEIIQTANGVVSYAMWEVPLDGSFAPFPVDSGAQWTNGIQRPISGRQLVMLSTNDIARFPKNAAQDAEHLLSYVPKLSEGDVSIPTLPTLSWDLDEKGFYTYIPISDQAPESDDVGGHVWYVPLQGPATDLGRPPGLTALDYVIPSGDGKTMLVGRQTVWTIRDTQTGDNIQTLPPVNVLFGWTPDYKGVVFRNQKLETAYLGIDGSTSSPLVPTLTSLSDIKWLPNGTTMYVVLGKDKKLSFSIQLTGKDPTFLSIIPNVDAYAARVLATKPGAALPPLACK
jgi:hypothetical protein